MTKLDYLYINSAPTRLLKYLSIISLDTRIIYFQIIHI